MQTPPTDTSPAGVWRQVFAGAGYLGKGFGMWITSPRLMFLGALPALIVGIVYVAALVLLAVNLDSVAVWATPFANDVNETSRTVIRVAAGIAIVITGIFLAVYTYAAVTLVVGDPFYERIWLRVERQLGDAPAERDLGVWRSILRGIGDGIRLVIPAVGVGILVFACGLIPVVGTVLAPVVGALFGGRLLAVELTGLAFDARGYTVRQRRAVLHQRRALTAGFGTLTYLLFLVPVLAVVVMPSAVAGAAMLSRDVLTTAKAPQVS
ncbi:EI24 domain-containing protein [Glaciihabitans sp. dw_435]|uniref:EI24 domain-containing protein n=1 Tax=Glaciihabitans sp. dw_435 TaxID=2720081 RepID=UPI001BD32A8A|nr:EI24 domain-containing protein [Glaciihabitans sp. dw_435]